jgi:hypothetical protein
LDEGDNRGIKRLVSTTRVFDSVTSNWTDRENGVEDGVADVGPTRSNKPCHLDAWIVSGACFAGLGIKGTSIVLVAPVLRDRFDNNAAGPSTYPVTGPNEAALYCTKTAEVIEVKSKDESMRS